MEEFTITTRYTKKEYIKVMFAGLYRKPPFILAMLVGIVIVTQLILYYCFNVGFYSETPWFEIIGGIFLLSFPFLIVFVSVRQLMSNPAFLDDLHYTFSEDGVKVIGLTFKAEFSWDHIIKQKEIGKFLILYHTKRSGNLIEKTKLTQDQLNFIRAKRKK